MSEVQENGRAPRYLQRVEWSFTAVFIVFIAGVLAANLAAVALFAAVGDDPTDIQQLVVVFGAQVAGNVAALLWLSRRDGTSNLGVDFGLRVRLGDWWAVLAGIALQIGVALLITPFVRLLSPDAPPQDIVQSAIDASGSLGPIIIFIAVVVVAPVLEEVIFRGMLLSRLLRSMGKWPAIAVSAGVFAIIHLVDPNAAVVVPGLFAIGLVLGYLAIRSGDLSLPILAHAGVNLTGVLLAMFADDLEELVEETSALVGWLG